MNIEKISSIRIKTTTGTITTNFVVEAIKEEVVIKDMEVVIKDMKVMKNTISMIEIDKTQVQGNK